MAVLQSTNVQGTLCVNGVAVGGGKDFKYCCFTASTTWTPSQDLVDGDGAINALIVGGGGSGGSKAGTFNCTENQCQHSGYSISPAGGGGAAWNSWLPITATTACTVTVGAGGTPAHITNPDFTTCSNFCACIRDAGTAAGDSSFGGKDGKGGGNAGAVVAFEHYGPSPGGVQAICCSGQSFNYGERFGGGSETFHYSACSGCFGNNTALVDVNNIDYVTGSGTQYAVWKGDNCFPNNGQGAPTFTGAGGNNTAAGGGACCNVDYLSPNGRISGINSWTSSIQLPTASFFGIGGNGEKVCYFQQYKCCFEYNNTGVSGNPGIVVLTWYE